MADTAIAEVQRRATEKLPHFVYPPAKPKFTSSGQSLILVSDNLEKHEMLINLKKKRSLKTKVNRKIFKKQSIY